jgi:hypothetical protein
LTDPPDPPSIFGYEEGNSIRAGTLQRLTCVCHGGNPLCQLKWFKGDQEVTQSTQQTTNGNVVSNEIGLCFFVSFSIIMFYFD